MTKTCAILLNLCKKKGKKLRKFTSAFFHSDNIEEIEIGFEQMVEVVVGNERIGKGFYSTKYQEAYFPVVTVSLASCQSHSQCPNL